MTNSEKIKLIINKLEKGHINLYHDISKVDLMAKVDAVDWNSLSAVGFDSEVLRLFSFFKDSHTCYDCKKICLNSVIKYLRGKAYLCVNDEFIEIESINGLDIPSIAKRFEALICYETTAWLNHTLNAYFCDYYKYQCIGFDGVLSCKLINGDIVKVGPMDRIKNVNAQINKPYYYEILDNGILYLKYMKCREDAQNPFRSVVKQIKRAYKQGKIGAYILDVRGNTGGNSEILNPFQKFVKHSKLQGTMLIDNGVFSSGRFAVARFKKYFNIPLIGEETGGAAKSYGYRKRDYVENLSFSYSIRLWDFSDIFGYDGSIQPDIPVLTTIEDLQNKNDRQLQVAISKTLQLLAPSVKNE